MPTKVVILISRRRVGRATTLRRQIADPLSGNLNRVDESALFVHLPPSCRLRDLEVHHRWNVLRARTPGDQMKSFSLSIRPGKKAAR